jgi:hypothetical protein
MVQRDEMGQDGVTGRLPRRDWTALEVKKLRQYSEQKSPIAEIGKVLRRSESALRQKAHEIGIALGQRQRRGK